MLNKMKLLIIAGARPNFMKVAPLLKAIDKYNKISNNSILVSFAPDRYLCVGKGWGGKGA